MDKRCIKNALCQVSLAEIGPVVLYKMMKMGKLYDNNDDEYNDNGQWTNFDQKSSLEPSAQVS
mgnify:CR=1 FL=1